MKARRSHIRNVAEYVLARSVLAAIRILPPGAMRPVSLGCGVLLQFLIKSRRRVVRENVALAFGESGSAPDPDSLCRESLASLCRSFMELDRIPRDADLMRRRLRIRDDENGRRLRAALADGPVVFAGSHFGAYEMGGLLGPLVDLDTTTIVRPLDNPLLERYLSRLRTRFGQRIVSNRGGLRELLRTLEAGGNVTVLVDLNHRPKRRVFVDYFGVPAATAPTAALLAVRANRPLACGFLRRLPESLHFEIEWGELHFPRPGADREEEVRRLMQAVTLDVEKRVRAEPELWLWTHRRWKTRPDSGA